MERALTRSGFELKPLEIFAWSLSVLAKRIQWRTIVTSSAVGLSLALAATAFKADVQLGIAAMLVPVAVALNPRRPATPILVVFAAIFGSAAGTTLFREGNLVGIYVMLPFALVVFARYDLKVVMLWLVGCAYLNVGWMLWQAGVGDVIRPEGLTNNANLVGGLLAICTIYLIASKRYYFALPLMLGIALSGSRLASVTTVSVLLALMVSRKEWRLLLLLSLVILLSFPLWQQIIAGYRIHSDILLAIRYRLDSPLFPGLVGMGWTSAIHILNIPVRLAEEWGLLAGVAWTGAVGYGLLKDRLTSRWWMLVAMVGLSMLDHYLWLPGLVGVWWAMIGQEDTLKEGERK